VLKAEAAFSRKNLTKVELNKPRSNCSLYSKTSDCEPEIRNIPWWCIPTSSVHNSKYTPCLNKEQSKLFSS